MYYQGMVDIDTLKQSSDYTNLKKSFIIFICKENPFKGKKLHKYTFSNMCHEKTGLELGDETVKIFLTPDSKADDISGEMERFMDFVVKKKGSSDFTKRLEDAVEAIKRDESWRPEYLHTQELYDEGWEEGRQEGREEGRQEGLNEGLLEGQAKFAESFIRTSESDGKTTEEIISDLQKYFKLSEAEAKGYYEKYSAMQPV